MDAFSYLSVLLSIIIGLAITQVLQGYRGLLLSRSHIKMYAPTMIWSALLLVFCAQLWWASFGLFGLPDFRRLESLDLGIRKPDRSDHLILSQRVPPMLP